MTAANQIVDLGLKDVGYEYVNSEQPPLDQKEEEDTGLAMLTMEHTQLMTAGQLNLVETSTPVDLCPTLSNSPRASLWVRRRRYLRELPREHRQ